MARASEDDDFRYQKRSTDAVKARANASGGGFDSIVKSKYKMYKVKDGKNLIRILPPTWKDAAHYGYDLWVNYSIGVDNQSYLSLHKMKGEADPLAEARRAAEKEGDKELVKALNPRQRVLMWIIDRNAEDEGPMLWACPVSVDKAFAGLSYDEDTKETVWIDDPKTGNDVRFYKEGQMLKTDYPVEKMRILKASPLHDDKGQAKEWLDFIKGNPLPECLNFYDYDHISMMFNGTAGTKSASNGADDEKPRRKAAPADEDDDEAPRKRTAPTDEDGDDEKPVRRRSSAADTDDDDDAEAVKPSRRAAADDDNEPPFEADPPRRGRQAIVDYDAEEDPKPRSSIRDRLKSRGRPEADDD